MEVNHEWEFVTIDSVSCIQWLQQPPDNEAKKRRKLKQKVCEKHVETLVIDRQYKHQRKAMCNLIFVTNRLERWVKESELYFTQKGFTVVQMRIDGGEQYAFVKNASTFISMSVYADKNKIMIQPGDRQENKLIAWISDFKQLKYMLDDMENDDSVNGTDEGSMDEDDSICSSDEMSSVSSIAGQGEDGETTEDEDTTSVKMLVEHTESHVDDEITFRQNDDRKTNASSEPVDDLEALKYQLKCVQSENTKLRNNLEKISAEKVEQAEDLESMKRHNDILVKNLSHRETDLNGKSKEINNLKKLLEKEKQNAQKACNMRDASNREKVILKETISHLEEELCTLKIRTNNVATSENTIESRNRAANDQTDRSDATDTNRSGETVKNIVRNELLIMGDENIRGLSQKLTANSFGYCYSGAKAEQVAQKICSINEKSKYTFIQAGMNNLDDELRISIPAMSKLLEEATKISDTESTVFINAIPYHLYNDKHNRLADSLNIFLEYKSRLIDNVQFVNCNPSVLDQYYESDGNQFNESGKKMLAGNIDFILRSINFPHLPRRQDP